MASPLAAPPPKFDAKQVVSNRYLSVRKLQRYLNQQFGPDNYHLQVKTIDSIPEYTIETPNELTPTQLADINDLIPSLARKKEGATPAEHPPAGPPPAQQAVPGGDADPGTESEPAVARGQQPVPDPMAAGGSNPQPGRTRYVKRFTDGLSRMFRSGTGS